MRALTEGELEMYVTDDGRNCLQKWEAYDVSD